MKFSLLFLSLGVTLGAFAQGTLQFNQVKLVTAQETVPAGKVWKVESALLGLTQGIRVSPWFRVNTDTIVMGYDSYNVSRWENVVSIQIQGRAGSTTGNTNIRLRIVGTGGGQVIDQTYSTPFSTNTNWSTLATHVPPSPGNNEIDRWAFWNYLIGSSVGGSDWEFRVVVNLSNGAQIVNTYSGAPGCCGNYGTTGGTGNNYVGSSGTTSAVERMDRVRPQISTSFPFWLGAGQTLQAGGNVRGLSVIEFNIQP